jgi:NAD(P)-dependent dehydrogenase (short-subunit alcohol dehydrogenase family)
MSGKPLTALVTGADHGLGACLVGVLAERGYFVFAGRRVQEHDEIDDIAARHAGRIVRVPLDVSSDSSVADAVLRVKREADGIDLLFNSAGVLGDITSTIPGPVDFADVISTYNVNAVGPLRVMNAFFSLFLAGTAKIAVSVSSESGSVGTCGRQDWYAYCMSKSALNMASALVHNRLRSFGGRVIVVHPGWMRTWMRGSLDLKAEIAPEEAARGIMGIVERALSGEKIFGGPQPAFLDYRGVPMNW